MAHGGYERLPDYDDDYPPFLDDDDDNADQTAAFVPFSSSTPGPDEIEFQTTQKEKSGLPKPPSFLEDLTDFFHQQLSLLRGRLIKSFPMQTKTRSNS